METSAKIKRLKEMCDEMNELSKGDDSISIALKHFRNKFSSEIKRLENLSKE